MTSDFIPKGFEVFYDKGTELYFEVVKDGTQSLPQDKLYLSVLTVSKDELPLSVLHSIPAENLSQTKDLFADPDFSHLISSLDNIIDVTDYGPTLTAIINRHQELLEYGHPIEETKVLKDMGMPDVFINHMDECEFVGDTDFEFINNAVLVHSRLSVSEHLALVDEPYDIALALVFKDSDEAFMVCNKLRDENTSVYQVLDFYLSYLNKTEAISVAIQNGVSIDNICELSYNDLLDKYLQNPNETMEFFCDNLKMSDLYYSQNTEEYFYVVYDPTENKRNPNCEIYLVETWDKFGIPLDAINYDIGNNGTVLNMIAKVHNLPLESIVKIETISKKDIEAIIQEHQDGMCLAGQIQSASADKIEPVSSDAKTHQQEL